MLEFCRERLPVSLSLTDTIVFLQYTGMLLLVLGVILNINVKRMKNMFAPSE